jgi:hypothetical protein
MIFNLADEVVLNASVILVNLDLPAEKIHLLKYYALG